MSDEDSVRQAIGLYRRLSDLLDDIRVAVVRADTERLSDLVPLQEEILRQVDGLALPPGASPELAKELQEAAAAAVRRNTQNGILLQEQLALIQVTMKAILGEGGALNRLA